MKLVISIVQDEDVHKLVDSLMENNYKVTKLASTGGFLKAGNTTLLIGVEKENLDNVLKIIEEKCKSRTKVTTSPVPTAWAPGVYMPHPIEVKVGGATIFVLDIDKYEKI